MIVSQKQSRIHPKATIIGRRSGQYGSIYTVGKRLVEFAGYYDEIKPFLPETYIDKYTYKPRKRVAGYLGQTIHAKKRYKTGYHKYEECLSGILRNKRYSNCY